MMDELELLKKDWQKKEELLPKLSYNEIYTMLWKKSSSIVKWILIISILELIIPNLIYLFPSSRESIVMGSSNFNTIFMVVTAIYYAVVLYFINQFYKRYKEISVLDSSRKLMRKIIRARRTVKHYIIFCLSMTLVFFIIYIFGIHLDDSLLLSIDGVSEKLKEVPLEKLKTMASWIIGIGCIIVLVVVGGIYFLLYGLLLRKLNHNYKELKKLEV